MVPDDFMVVGDITEVLDHLHVWANSQGYELEPGTILRHGWVENGSSKVIWLSLLSSEIEGVLLVMHVEVCRVLNPFQDA